MKITPDSHKLMLFFRKHNCLPHIKQTSTTNNFFKKIYYEIDAAAKYITSIKTQLGNTFYKLKIQKINSINQIPKPNTFPIDGIPDIIHKHIDEYSFASLTYTFYLFDRPITIIFLIEEDNPQLYIEIYNTYVEHMLTWLYMVNNHASHSCAEKLTIFIYHTSLTKELPKTSIEILNEQHVNTAFTMSCPTISEIVVFRKEEWFKVFMHETFHNFALDFSDMNTSVAHSKIITIFPVKSDVNLFEAYTEFWARIMNVLFCSYFNAPNKNINVFLKHSEYFMNLEIMYAFFQMTKVLHFMNLEYRQLYKTDKKSAHLRQTLYKENTNVLSYYVITMILIFNYQPFLSWCNTNNTSLFQFKKTIPNQVSFCDFIEKKYKTTDLLLAIDCTINLFNNIKDAHLQSGSTKLKNISYLMNNLRMTICELS